MNGTQVNTPYEYNSQYPLDTRLQFDTIVEMAGFDVTCLYDGCISYCKELRALFMFDSNNQNIATYGRWRYVSTGMTVWTITGNDEDKEYTITDGTSDGNAELLVGDDFDIFVDFIITNTNYNVTKSVVTKASSTGGGSITLTFNDVLPATVKCKVLINRVLPTYCY